MAEEFVKINGYEVSKDYKSVFENASSSQLYKVAGGDTKITEEEIKKFNITTKTSEDELSILIENDGDSTETSDTNKSADSSDSKAGSTLQTKIENNADLEPYKESYASRLETLGDDTARNIHYHIFWRMGSEGKEKCKQQRATDADNYSPSKALIGFDQTSYDESGIGKDHYPEHGVDSWTCDWEGWLEKTVSPKLNEATTAASSINASSKPEEIEEVFKQLANIAYALQEAKANTEAWTSINEAGVASDLVVNWNGHGWTRELNSSIDSYIEKTTSARTSAESALTKKIIDGIAKEANGKIGDILKDDFKFDKVEDIDVEQISEDTQNLVKYQDKLQPYVDLCIQYGISCESLYDGLDKLFEGENGAHDYAQNYVNSFAETAKKEVTGDAVSDTFDMSKFAEEVGTLAEDVEASGLNSKKLASLIKSTATANQKESDEKADDAKKKKTGSSSTGNGSGQPSTSSAPKTTTTTVASPVGTVANTLGQAQNATQTGQAIQGATGSGYTINTGAWDDAATSLTDDAQQTVNTYGQALSQITSDNIADLEEASENAKGVLSELQETAGQLDMGEVSTGIGSIETEEQGLVDQEAQTATEHAAGTTSGAETSKIMGELSEHDQTYQGYGMDTGKIQQSLTDIQTGQETYLAMLAEDTKAKIPTIKTSAEAKELLDSTNAVIQDNQAFDTSALQQVAQSISAKYQELYKKEQQEIKNQTYIQTVTPQVDSYTSTADTTKTLADINTLLQQSQGLDTSGLEQLKQTVNTKHQTLVQKEQEDTKIQTYVQNTTPVVETLTEASQAFSMLSSANMLLQEGQSLGANTTELELLIQKLNTKYQELMQKETNPTDGQTNSNANPTNNTSKEPAESPNDKRPLDEDKSGIEVTTAGVKYHDENGDNKPSTISLTSANDDKEDDNFTFSLTSPAESNSSDNNSDKNASSSISLTSNSSDKKSAEDKDSQDSDTKTNSVSTKSEDKTTSTDKAKPADETKPADNTASDNTAKPEDGVKPTDETKSADEVTSSNSSEVAKPETAPVTANSSEDKTANKTKDEDLEIIIDE